MTKKEFKQALLRGQGRCILAVRQNPEKYRDLVMWACQRRISFDTQSEGARTWFVYQLVCCYDDASPFIEAAADRLRICRSDGGWTIFSLSELLSFFAMDGSYMARAALEYKYCQLYDSLMARKRPKNGLFPERDDFEQLCVIMAENCQSFLKIAGDLGRLYRLRPFYDGFDFDWLYETKGKPHMTALRKAAKKSENLAYYLQKQQEYERKCEERHALPRPQRKGRSLSIWLARKADRETVMQYARKYLEQMEPLARAEALELFCRCPFPADPLPVLTDAVSDCAELRDAAWEALENIRHPLVRDFVLTKLDEDPCRIISVLAKNYQPEHAALLEKLVTSIPVSFEGVSDWHSAGLDVLEMVDDGLKAPPSLLRYIYETTYCSCCREYALRQMGKRRMLSQEILEECQYDSSETIRSYAKRMMNRRKAKR